MHRQYNQSGSSSMQNELSTLVNQLGAVAAKHLDPQTVQNLSLFEMKHDLIKMSALIAQITHGGGRGLVNAIFKNPDEMNVLRNGALHLIKLHLESQQSHPEQIEAFFREFYAHLLQILSRLSILNQTSNVNQLFQKIKVSESFPIDIQESFVFMESFELAQQTYQLFEANYIAWKVDHDCNRSVNVEPDIKQRLELLSAQWNTLSHAEKVMIAVEVAELYKQGKNAGFEFHYFPDELVRLKNNFTHTAADITDQQIMNFIKTHENKYSTLRM